MSLSRAKTAERHVSWFRSWTHVGPRNRVVVDGALDPTTLAQRSFQSLRVPDVTNSMQQGRQAAAMRTVATNTVATCFCVQCIRVGGGQFHHIASGDRRRLVVSLSRVQLTA